MARTAVIIDDEPDIRRYISSILEDNGFDTKTAEDARAGEDLVLESPPDLICVDLMMPGRSGIQLFVRLKKNKTTAQIPLIMITGIKEQMNIDWADIAKGLMSIPAINARHTNTAILVLILPSSFQIVAVPSILVQRAKGQIGISI